MRQQSWRDFSAQAQASGDADSSSCSMPASAAQLDQAFETSAARGRRVSAGRCQSAGCGTTWKALEQFWDALKLAAGDDRSGDHVQDAEASASNSRAVDWRAVARDRPAVAGQAAQLLGCQANVTPEVVG